MTDEIKVSWGDDWEEAPMFLPPPPAGDYRAFIHEIREVKPFRTVVDGAELTRINAVLDFKILGGPHDGETVNFQRISNMEFQRRGGSKVISSKMSDLLNSSGFQPQPYTNDGYEAALNRMKEDKRPCAFTLEWEGFCSTCYGEALKTATSCVDLAAAKSVANKDQFKLASNAGMKAKNYRGFPEDNNGGRLDFYLCPACNGEIRARARIVQFRKAPW